MNIEKAYNIWADQYDTNSNKTRDLDTKSTIKTLNKFDFAKVIELGCGTGKNTTFLLKKADKIIGIKDKVVIKAIEFCCTNGVYGVNLQNLKNFTIAISKNLFGSWLIYLIAASRSNCAFSADELLSR